MRALRVVPEEAQRGWVDGLRGRHPHRGRVLRLEANKRGAHYERRGGERMSGMRKTAAQARAYASRLESLTGVPRLVCVVPPWGEAYAQGWRFGVCEASERDAYQTRGAVIVVADEGAKG